MRIITLIVSLVTAVVVIALLTRMLTPEAAAILLDVSRSSWPFTVQNVLWLAFFAGLPAFVVAFAGLLRFKLWARRLFTFLMIAWGCQAVAFGIVNLSLTWGLSGLFANLALLTAGAVLAMSYFTPISELFASSGRLVASQEATQFSPA